MNQINIILSCCLLSAALVGVLAYPNQYQQQQHYISRRSNSNNQDATIVIGKFKAPAPERILRQKIPKNVDSANQVMSASYRVTDNADNLPEKVVHGVPGASVSVQQRKNQNQRIVSAKIQVSDEGLNYPPSKLSADIYGNVAEIVTAPPEAVEGDFLLPETSKLFGSRRAN